MRIAWIIAAGVGIVGLTVTTLATCEQSKLVVSAAPARQEVLLDSASAKPTTDSPATPGAVERDFEKELRNAQDRKDFAEMTLAEAKRGNGAAQYYLSLALSDCKAFDDMFFRDGDRRRTYDEAMQYTIRRGGMNWEYVADVFRRCKPLLEVKDSPFGSAEGWLNAATESGYPLAQAHAAVGKAWKSRFESDPEQAREERAEARRLALQALRTKDPGAIFAVGDAASVLDRREGAANPHDWVWMLAACARGYDCSRQSAWYQFHCSYDPLCQPYENGVVDVVQRETGSRFPELERRATELNDKLDQDRFDELGF